MTFRADRSTACSSDPAAGPVYGLDIETDTATDGLDPLVGRILAVALAGPGGEAVLAHHDEAAMLTELDALVADVTPGTIVTWNGAAFDLPYLATRAHLLGVPLGLHLALDTARGRHHAPLRGHLGAYRASWHRHAHLDAYRVFKADVGPALHVSCSLKSIAGLVGVPAIDADPSRVHELPAPLLHAYVASDARCTRQLALRRWASASSGIDRWAGTAQALG